VRILFADDQIPDDGVPDDQIVEAVRREYPAAHDGFIRAFAVMRQARRAASEDNDVTVARRLADALSLVESGTFDVAIIDLGWYWDPSVPEVDRPTAGWKIATALDEADRRCPERPPTAQIIYSARFDSEPQLAERAASKGKLPVLKPYAERFTIPLESPRRSAKGNNSVSAACQSLRATLSFIEHVRGTGGLSGTTDARAQAILLSTSQAGLQLAIKRENQWDRLTRYSLALGIAIVLAGVISSFFFGISQGAVTAASGVVVSLIPKLLYNELHKTREAIDGATSNLRRLVIQAQGTNHEAQQSPESAPGRTPEAGRTDAT